MRRLLLLLVLTQIIFAAGPLKERWASKYFYDEESESLTITDFAFPSVKRGIACGLITDRKDKSKPIVLVTSDAGERWTLVPVKEAPRSLYFLDDAVGWMVGERNLWKTEESGRSWRKLNAFPKGILRVWFTTAERGWAVGFQKQVFQTADGGQSWTPLAIAAEPKMNPDFSIYDVITFDNKGNGVIAGWNNPPRRGDAADWIDPGKARDRPQWPTTIALLQTADGGATWNATTASLFGHMARISLDSGGGSLGLVEFQDNFAYPSEVYFANRNLGGKNERVFRQANRAITDVLLTGDGTGFLAGVEATGTLRSSPVPGKVKILKSTTMKTWMEMPVDYRADAHRVFLAAPDQDHVWAATDTGMILKLVREP